jgi:hypothetical protein
MRFCVITEAMDFMPSVQMRMPFHFDATFVMFSRNASTGPREANKDR